MIRPRKSSAGRTGPLGLRAPGSDPHRGRDSGRAPASKGLEDSDEARAERRLLDLARRNPDGIEGRRAVCELLARYQTRVYLWCYRYVHDHDRALDMTQEVLMSAFRHLASFEGRSRFGSWLFTITRNRCISEARRPAILIEEEVEIDALRHPGGGPDERHEEGAEAEALYELIRTRLTPIEQEAIWMRCYEGIPVDEITKVLRIEDASGARGLLQRARRKLRAALEERGEGPMGVPS